MGSVDASTSGGSITARLSPSRRATRASRPRRQRDREHRRRREPRAGRPLQRRRVSSDLPITVRESGDDSLQGRIGSGGPKLVVRSSGAGFGFGIVKP